MVPPAISGTLGWVDGCAAGGTGGFAGSAASEKASARAAMCMGPASPPARRTQFSGELLGEAQRSERHQRYQNCAEPDQFAGQIGEGRTLEHDAAHDPQEVGERQAL